MSAFVESLKGNVTELKVAQLRAIYTDALGHRFKSTADLVFVIPVQVTDAWQVRNIRPAVPDTMLPR